MPDKKKTTKKKATKKKVTKKNTPKATANTTDFIAEGNQPTPTTAASIRRLGIGSNYIEDTREVHDTVSAGFKYVSDEKQWGTIIDDWRIPEDCKRVTGDCDDFAIACRELLREKGHKPRLLFCLTETGDGHLICVLGKMALDNRQRSAVEIEDLVSGRKKYTLVTVSGRVPGEEWRAIEMVS